MNEVCREIGVYTLANDIVIEWFEAFVRSFQLKNPDLPLTVIPFNSNMTKLRALQHKYHFQIMDESMCAKFDELSTIVMGRDHAAGMYRKLACFFGPYEKFVFLDSDICLTISLNSVFDAFCPTKYDFIYFDFDIDAAYSPTFAVKMQNAYGSHGFNAGAFASRKSLFGEKELWQLAGEAAKERGGLIIGTIDQPFLNFIMDVTYKRMTHIDALLSNLSRKAYARQHFTFDSNSFTAQTNDGKFLPFIHWAGCAYPTMVRKEIFLKFRTLGMGALESAAYCARFYYHRIRRNIKITMLKYALTTKLVEWREGFKQP